MDHSCTANSRQINHSEGSSNFHILLHLSHSKRAARNSLIRPNAFGGGWLKKKNLHINNEWWQFHMRKWKTYKYNGRAIVKCANLLWWLRRWLSLEAAVLLWPCQRTGAAAVANFDKYWWLVWLNSTNGSHVQAGREKSCFSWLRRMYIMVNRQQQRMLLNDF